MHYMSLPSAEKMATAMTTTMKRQKQQAMNPNMMHGAGPLDGRDSNNLECGVHQHQTSQYLHQIPM
jgi:hypothetical protein